MAKWSIKFLMKRIMNKTNMSQFVLSHSVRNFVFFDWHVPVTRSKQKMLCFWPLGPLDHKKMIFLNYVTVFFLQFLKIIISPIKCDISITSCKEDGWKSVSQECLKQILLEKTSSINYKYVFLGNIIHQNQTYFTVHFFTHTYRVSCDKFSILGLILRKTLHFFLYTLFPNLLMLNFGANS